ncbi:MAG: GNAT family N-acetyltransferase [Xanthobacteraceae bacterium]|nr:GNAT family N-acetyltransferase [Xanthobacteraceae bacterium]
MPTLQHGPLHPEELNYAQALVTEVGWNQTERDWRMFLELGRVQAVRTDTGNVVATAATLPYVGFGWISMVLVTAAWRRRGLASNLLGDAVDRLRGAGLVPILDATPTGREVYRGLGFADTWGFARYARPALSTTHDLASGRGGIDVRLITDAIWHEICAYDAATFGSERNRLLAHLRGRMPPATLVALRGDRLVGFLLGREGRIATQLGPLVAEEVAAAHALLTQAFATITGPIFIDLADSKAETRRFIEAQGFAFTRPLTRMVYARGSAFDDGVRTFAVVGPEFG